MIVVDFTYNPLVLVGGPFHGEIIIRPTSMPDCALHCEGDADLVHVYEPVGSTLVYSSCHQRACFSRATQDEMSGVWYA